MTSLNTLLGTYQIGRLRLQESQEATVDASENARGLNISARESSVIGMAEVLARQTEVLGLRGQVVPILAQHKTSLNGFYEIEGVSVDIRHVPAPHNVVMIEWDMNTRLIGGFGDVEIESLLTGVARQTDHSITAERWHAPAVGAFGYYAGSAAPGTVSRVSEDGVLTVYRNVAQVAPRWGIAPDDYYLGAARIEVAGVERSGRHAPNTPAAWGLDNGLIRVSPINEGIEVAAFTGGLWRSKHYEIRQNGVTAWPWQSVTILRNDPEECVVRLSHALTVGRVTIDLAVRRGSRFVHGIIQRHAAGSLAVRRATNEGGTNFTGGIRASANDGDGNRYVLGSARTHTTSTTVGEIARANAVFMDFFIGIEAGGSGASAGDQFSNLMAQYIGLPAERQMVVNR